jgi:hypothetical protein
MLSSSASLSVLTDRVPVRPQLTAGEIRMRSPVSVVNLPCERVFISILA